MREVELPFELELLLLLAREDPVEELLRVLRGEGVITLQPLHVSAHANDRGCPRRHMEVRRVPRHHVLAQLVDGVGRRHNSNESSACREASFTPTFLWQRIPHPGVTQNG